MKTQLAKAKNTSPGADGIHYTHLKNLPDIALQYLAKLYETSWRCAYFPDMWKEATVILLPKPEKDKTQPKNYRPISLLPTMGKLFERLINDEIMKQLESENRLPESQAGFRAKRSTQDQLLKMMQDAIQAKNTGQTLVSTMFDIEKAYDKIWHEAAVYKFHKIGLEEQMVALLKNYLTNRNLQIRIKGELSEKVTLRAGTPQAPGGYPEPYRI